MYWHLLSMRGELPVSIGPPQVQTEGGQSSQGSSTHCLYVVRHNEPLENVLQTEQHFLARCCTVHTVDSITTHYNAAKPDVERTWNLSPDAKT